MGGSDSGQELFCPQGETGTWSPDKPKGRNGCAAVAGSVEVEGTAWIAIAALALLVARRRSPRC
jgi:hypothetical protein